MARGAAVVPLAIALLLAGCGFDEAQAGRLEELVGAFDAPPEWERRDGTEGPFADRGFDLTYAGPLCTSNDCLHATVRWQVPDRRPDIDALDAAVAAAPGWDVVHVPDDCDLDPDERHDPDRCVWEADAGDEYVLVSVRRLNDGDPWTVQVSAYTDSYIHRGQNSPVLAGQRRDAAADLLAVTDQLDPPVNWGDPITDTVLAEPEDCLDVACLTTLRTWTRISWISADQVVRLIEDTGWTVIEAPHRCEFLEDGAQPGPVCTFTARRGSVALSLEVVQFGDLYEVDLQASALD